ncbi:MAG: FecR family protein [Myxococcota bacterium]|nr:FecR family protein [Myxococcota bacterium]
MSFPRPLGAQWLVALALVLFVSACEDDPETPPVAWLVEHTGKVRIDRQDSAEGASKDAPLFHDNLVSTGAASTATVRYSDRTQVKVGENTRFRIGGQAGRLTLELEAGTILSSSRQGGAGGLTIVTRYGQLQLLQGSEIQFSLGTDGQSSMQVLFGSIQLLTTDGGSVTVLQGEAMNFDLGTTTRLAEAADAGVPPEAVTPQALPLQLVFSAPRGKATLKPEGSARFSPASTEEAPIQPGTQFRLAKNGAAVLRGKGLSSRLSQTASGVVGPAEQDGELERYALALQNGNAELEFTHRGTRRVVLESRGREAVLESSDLGSVGVLVGRRGLEVLVRAGEVKLTAGGETRTLTTGDQVELVGNVLRPTRKLTASLSLPLSRKLRVYANRLETVALTLPEQEQPFRVEVARDAEFTDRLLSGTVQASRLVVPAPASGELHWRAVSLEAGAGEKELGRGQARFFADRQTGLDLDNPHAEVAETGLKATVLFQSVPPAVTFSFAAKPDARSYRVRVFRAADLKKPVVEKVVPEPKCELAAGQIPEGEYLWNATPLGASGGELSGGRMNRLELIYDNSRTSLAISRPRPMEVVSASASALTVEGVAPVGSKLFVNGKPVPVGEKGRFSQQVARADTLVFRLVTSNGAEGYWVRPLRRRQ